MAGNSSTFYLRQTMNDANIKLWQSWSVDINYVVSQFNDTVNNLTNKLNLANTTILALNVKIEKIMEKLQGIDLNYILLLYDNIELPSSENAIYDKQCGVFSSVDNKPNIVYMYAKLNINGLYVNDYKVYHLSIGEYSELSVPFGSFTGSNSGSIITLKSNNIDKIGEDIELYFSTDSLIDTSSMINYDPTNNDIAKLTIKVNYSTVINKPLITLDKSALSMALTKTNIMSTDAITVTKYALPIGQYSTLKTIAQIAKNKVTNKTI